MNKLKYFCCICMQNSKALLGLNRVDVNNLKYIRKLKFCVPKQTWNPLYQICDLCASQLDAAYNFIQCCLESEQFRKVKLTNHKNLSILEEEDEGKNLEIRDIKFTCDHCNKSFRQKKYLSQHITKLHINKKIKAGSKKSIKKEQEDKSVLEVTEQEISRDIKTENGNIIKEDETVKEEDLFENMEYSLKEEKDDIKDFKFEPSDTECLGESTDAGNDIENDYSAESEAEYDLNIPGKTSSKKRGPKKEPLKCSFCDEVFTKRHDWARHIRKQHTFQKPFSCDQCDAKYMNGYSLLIHKRKHTNEKPFICATCGKSFVSSADLNHHNKIHDADRAYPCPMCDRSFKTHSNLRTHRLQMHLDPAEWKFPCHLCEKKFPIRGNLVKHLKRHAGIKEFNCHICDKRFVNKAEMTLHLNTHTNQRMFKCSLCGKDYKNREGLRRHMKVVHDQGNWKAPKFEKKHLCPMCPKIFAFGNKLQRHIFTHTGEKPFKCDYCQKRFIDNYGRKVHYKKDHNVDFVGL